MINNFYGHKIDGIFKVSQLIKISESLFIFDKLKIALYVLSNEQNV